MTFVETRTSAADVVEDVLKEVRAMANRIFSDARTHREHPSYITKTAARENLLRLHGAAELARRVSGDFPDDLEHYIAKAYLAFAAEWGKA